MLYPFYLCLVILYFSPLLKYNRWSFNFSPTYAVFWGFFFAILDCTFQQLINSSSFFKTQCKCYFHKSFPSRVHLSLLFTATPCFSPCYSNMFHNRFFSHCLSSTKLRVPLRQKQSHLDSHSSPSQLYHRGWHIKRFNKYLLSDKKNCCCSVTKSCLTPWGRGVWPQGL